MSFLTLLAMSAAALLRLAQAGVEQADAVTPIRLSLARGSLAESEERVRYLLLALAWTAYCTLHSATEETR
jgi:hypothetical protein